MSGRGEQLQVTADEQLGELIGLIATLDDTTARLPCPGREKLGDGTIAACAQHAADNFQRIADFVRTSETMTAGAHEHADTVKTVNLSALREQLSATRESLKRIATLTDRQLQTIPPDGSFRFCDGQRTLDVVLEGLLKHQSHQVGALAAALV